MRSRRVVFIAVAGLVGAFSDKLGTTARLRSFGFVVAAIGYALVSAV